MHSDKTASKAVKLAGMACTASDISSTGRWIDEYLQADYRAILVARWRGYRWEAIARRLKLTQFQVVRYWEEVIMSLMEFVSESSNKSFCGCTR